MIKGIDIAFNETIKEFIDYCKDNEISIYLVGGAIRDYLVNKTSYDYDFALTSDYNEARKKLAKYGHLICNHHYRAIKFNLGDYKIEISHCRIEGEYQDYRHPSKIEFCDDIKLDSNRRDFTINALYYKDKQIYDFYHGLAHLKNKSLVMIGDTLTRFREDALRILRMIRFASYGFIINSKDKEIIMKSKKLLNNLKRAAFDTEFNQILMINNLEIIKEYQSVFESYFQIEFNDVKLLSDFKTLEEKRKYLGIY